MGLTALWTARRKGEPGDTPSAPPAARRVVLVGSPNVGKSAVFNALTGRYVTVSNYPGTTVEISRGRSKALGAAFEVIDTPGMYSLLPVTDEERVARAVLLGSSPHAVVHVVDAKNLQRMLPLTIQLIQAELPVVVALNMSDEAAAAGIRVDAAKLEKLLGTPVGPTVATTGEGIAELTDRIRSLRPAPPAVRIDYGPVLEEAIAAIEKHLPPREGIGPRARAILLLHGDHEEIERLFATAPAEAAEEVSRVVWDTCMKLGHTLHYDTAMAVRAFADGVIRQAAEFPAAGRGTFRQRLSDLCMSPWTGLPLLALVLYLGLYEFVGRFGAGTVVDWLDTHVFEAFVNPAAERAAEAIVPWAPIRDLLVGEFGVITLGLRYALAIVLPIVATFFLAFSLLEDSGYLPRLAMLIDRLFKRIGLNGRAVIPMVLGLGCDTMATLVTRTLETRRERVIATFLLALAVPCSAQMGVILGLLAGRPAAMLVWAGIVAGVLLAAGTLLGRFLPGERPTFYMELPPLRLPRLGNVLVKTFSRMVWYLREVLPFFLLASVVIWLGRITGLFDAVIAGLKPVVRLLGLPDEAAVAFLFGFFRRDYGAAGLFDLHRAGALAGNQLVVAAVTLTLFLPCVAQLLVMKKERGLRMTLAISAFVTVFALAVGWALNAVLTIGGVRL